MQTRKFLQRSLNRFFFKKLLLAIMADSKPFECDLCESTFTQKFSLKQHYTKVHKLSKGALMATSYSDLADSRKALPEKECPHCGTSFSHSYFSSHLKSCKSKPPPTASAALGAPSAKESRSERAKKREKDDEIIPGSPTKNDSFSMRGDLTEDFRSWMVAKDLSRDAIARFISILQKVVQSFTGRSNCNRSNIAKGFYLLSDHIRGTANDFGKRKDFLRSESQLKKAFFCNRNLFNFMKETFGEEIKVFTIIQVDESFDQTLDASGEEIDIEPQFEAQIQPALNQQPELVTMPQQQNLTVEEVLPQPQPSTSSRVKTKGDVNFTEDDLRVIFLEFEKDIIRHQNQVLVRCMDEGDLGFFLFCEKKCREENITTDELAKAIFKVLKEQNRRTPTESLDAFYSRKLLEHGESDDGLPLKSKYFNGKGYGIVATAKIPKGSFVCEYVGELLSPEEADEREKAYEDRGDVHTSYMYYFRSGERKYCIDATEDNGRFGRLINHSKTNANLTTRKLLINKVPRLFFIAKCDIPARAELLYPYGDNRPEILKQHQWLKK